MRRWKSSKDFVANSTDPLKPYRKQKPSQKINAGPLRRNQPLEASGITNNLPPPTTQDPRPWQQTSANICTIYRKATAGHRPPAGQSFVTRPGSDTGLRLTTIQFGNSPATSPHAHMACAEPREYAHAPKRLAADLACDDFAGRERPVPGR